MESLEAKKLINKIQKGLIKNGIDAEAIVADLKTLRPYALEEKDPLVTKVIRMAYEHIEATGTFDIEQPEEELDEEDEEIEKEEVDESVDTKLESLDFFLSLLANSEHKINRPDITAYKFAFIAYAEG